MAAILIRIPIVIIMYLIILELMAKEATLVISYVVLLITDSGP
jgi:hypothetical protein